MKVDESIIRHLKHLCRSYDNLTAAIVSMKNRVQALMPEATFEQDEIIQIESIKNKIARNIKKLLNDHWPIYSEWLVNVNGVGPFIAGNLILLYYYRFVPICQKCGTKATFKDDDSKEHWCPECEKPLKGEGISKYAIEEKDFPNISKWWSYMGRGKGVPKRKKGVQSNWPSRGRMIGYMFGDQINRQNGDDPYKKFLLERKKKRERTHPDATKGHRHNMARNETAKLFLSHFWLVARQVDGKPITKPYAETIMGHTGILDPFYWEPN